MLQFCMFVPVVLGFAASMQLKQTASALDCAEVAEVFYVVNWLNIVQYCVCVCVCVCVLCTSVANNSSV